MTYRGGRDSRSTVIEALKANPGVGLIFIRENNEEIEAGKALPSKMNIRVLDRTSDSSRITVWRDEPSGELVFRYRVDDHSERDPLGYGKRGLGEGTVGTYREWNDLSADPGSDHDTFNAVAGVGSYLFSNNPAIGDVLVMNGRGWNFGDNAAGHGGLHRGEKRIFILVSGPEVGSGELHSRSRYRTKPDGTVEPYGEGRHYPSLLDIAPTSLFWLGHSENALDEFARDGFEVYLRDWVGAQRGDILEHLGGSGAIDRALEEAGFNAMRVDRFEQRLERLLKFVSLPADQPGHWPAASHTTAGTDGNQLILR
jgi:hypothetical protein